MLADRARLVRLRRIERLRDVEKLELARRSAVAENTLSQLSLLVDRTARLATDYAASSDADDGAALRRQQGFSVGLRSIHRTAIADASFGQSQANALRSELAAAEQRRSSVEERANATADALARAENSSAHVQLARKLNRVSRRTPDGDR